MSTLGWQPAWQAALYQDAHGFYRRTRAGAHFATPAQGVPGVTRILANALVALARRAAVDAVVEIGAGGGELLAAMADLSPDLALVGSDVGPRPTALPDTVAWHEAPGGADLAPTLPRRLENSLVVAVEWLDVIPCAVLEVDAAGRPRLVLVDRDSGAESPGPPADPADIEWCRRWWPTSAPGTRIEVGRPRDDAWSALLDRMRGGLALAVDYGHERATRPPSGTLMGFRAGRVVRPVPDGRCDLTAHVAVDALRQERRITQRDALHELLRPPMTPDPDLAGRDPMAYAEALAASSAWGRLVDPRGLGAFWWVTARPCRRRPRL